MIRMAKIKDIKSKEIFDSRGNPTLETQVILDDYTVAKAAVPSGASKGSHEVYELRDEDRTRFQGLGVLKAVRKIEEEIKPLLRGIDITKQKKIDELMIQKDGTDNKSKLGGNSILSVSLACARAGSKFSKTSLYKYIQQIYGKEGNKKSVTPLFNVINGGLHGANKLNIQEFLLIPNPKLSFKSSFQIGITVYQNLKNILKQKGQSCAIGDEGGFSPEISSNNIALELIKQAIIDASYTYSKDVFLGLDMAASTYFKNNLYYVIDLDKPLGTQQYISYLIKLATDFKLFSLEDPLYEDDWQGWQKLTQKVGNKALIVGDDLLVTNKARLEKAIRLKACNSILVKVNQIGTLTETLEVVKLAQKSNFKVIISHRSGETNDDFIADLAVGVGADFVKFGAPVRGERVAKYNRLLEIYNNIN